MPRRYIPRSALVTAVPAALFVLSAAACGGADSNGRSGVPDDPLTIDAGSRSIAWVALSADDEGPLVVAVDEGGRIIRFRLPEGDPLGSGSGADSLPAGMPPLVEGGVVVSPPADATPLAPPVRLPDGRIAAVTEDGALVVSGPGGSRRLEVDALPDAHPLVDDRGRVLVLTGPTDRYGHGVLGDALEASGWSIVDPDAGTILATVRFDTEVIEGIAPIWVDIDGDGTREIVATTSTTDAGARIGVYDEAGVPVALGPPIGRGNRWRHQIATGPLGPGGETEIVSVRTPHIGGIVEFLRPVDGALEIVAASSPVYTSHVIGSRNLEMAFAADLDGDGRIEAVVLSSDRTALAGVAHTPVGAAEVWRRSIGGTVSSNLASLATDIGIAVAAGRADGSVVVLWWPPG